MRTQVGIIGAGPAGLLLSHSAAASGDRIDHRRGAVARVLRGPHSRRRARARQRRSAQRDGRRRTHDARRARASRHLSALRRQEPPPRFRRAHRQDDHGLRPARSREGSHRARALPRAAEICSKRATCSIERFDTAQPAIRFHDKDGTAQRIDVRFHRRLRRLPRHLPAERFRRTRSRSTIACIRSRGSAFLPMRRRCAKN